MQYRTSTSLRKITLASTRTFDTAPAAEPTGPALLESVGIVFRLLDELALARRPLGVTELAQIVDEPKPRVYRHLASMKQVGAVEQDPFTEKYRLGAKLVLFGTAAAEQFDLRALADPYLTRLRDVTGQTAVLAVATHDSALVVSAAESTRSVVISVKPGNRPATHCSAQGRLVLAYLDEAAQQRVLRRKLQQFTDRSMTDPAEIQARLAIIRERLYEDADGEVIDGINLLAAPIFRGRDVLVGSIGVIGPSRDVPSPPTADLLGAIQSIAAELSARLNSNMYERLLGNAGLVAKG
jgi:DNA-binding IclR family transcriptional regulator